MTDYTEELLSKYSPEVQEISRALRDMARRVTQGAHEFLYHAAINYAPTISSFDGFCYIAPQRQWVNLGFYFGTHLPDPEHLLIGEGARMRHVKVWSVEEAKNPALEKLVIAAWADAPGSVAALHAKRKKSKA